MLKKLGKVIGIILVFLQIVAIIQTIREGGNLVGESCAYSYDEQSEISCIFETIGFYLFGIIGMFLLIKSKKDNKSTLKYY